jgi:hypothetical protein
VTQPTGTRSGVTRVPLSRAVRCGGGRHAPHAVVVRQPPERERTLELVRDLADLPRKTRRIVPRPVLPWIAARCTAVLQRCSAALLCAAARRVPQRVRCRLGRERGLADVTATVARHAARFACDRPGWRRKPARRSARRAPSALARPAASARAGCARGVMHDSWWRVRNAERGGTQHRTRLGWLARARARVLRARSHA